MVIVSSCFFRIQHGRADIDLGSLSPSWQKSFHDSDRVRRVEGGDTVALSAFMLSSLPTPLARKTMVKEMWESGADVMVVTLYRIFLAGADVNIRRRF